MNDDAAEPTLARRDAAGAGITDAEVVGRVEAGDRCDRIVATVLGQIAKGQQ